MKIVLANYRYYVSGGPEIYMFNVKRLLEEAGHTVIPYSVRSPLNEETPFARYFPHGKSESGDAYFDNVKKTPKNIMRLLSCAFYNKEAYKNLRRLIRDEKPDVVYVLQQINALSPSVFKAANEVPSRPEALWLRGFIRVPHDLHGIIAREVGRGQGQGQRGADLRASIRARD